MARRGRNSGGATQADEAVLTVTASPFRTMILPDKVRYVPLADLSQNPTGFFYYWQMMEVVFNLPDPTMFPTLSGFSTQERTTIKRFVDACEELAGSTLLSHGGGYTLTYEDGVERTARNDPPREALRGSVVLFRQIAAKDEKASFHVVSNIIGKRTQEVDDLNREARKSYLKGWRRAHGRLLSDSLENLADAVAIGRMGGDPARMHVPMSLPPMALLSLFQYGDLIHWGLKREEHAALVTSDFQFARHFYDFVAVVTQLSHVYLGFSQLARAALGDTRHVSTL